MNGTDIDWIGNDELKQNPVKQGGTYTVNSNMIFHAVWDTGKPVELSQKHQEGVANYIKNLPNEVFSNYRKENGEALQCPVTMSGATVAPAKILEAAKGKDIDLVLDMGPYSWTINGKDISDADKNVNLEVLEKDAVPQSAVSSLAGNRATKELSLTYDGDFGFKAVLSYNVGKEYAGKYGNLFWYKTDGTFEFISDGLIDEDGDVSLTFTHASDYVIVMNDQAMSSADAKNANDQIIASRSTTGKKSPKTGQF